MLLVIPVILSTKDYQGVVSGEKIREETRTKKAEVKCPAGGKEYSLSSDISINHHGDKKLSCREQRVGC